MTKNFSQTAAFIWSVADLLRGDFKQSQYGRIIIPFTLLRRLECVLEETKDAVVAESQRIADMGLPEEAQEKFIIRASKRPFYSVSPMDLSKMGQSDIKDNLNTYVQSFPKMRVRFLSTSSLQNLSVNSTMPTCSTKSCKRFGKPI